MRAKRYTKPNDLSVLSPRSSLVLCPSGRVCLLHVPARNQDSMTAEYLVIIQEHDSTPWDDGHAFTREGAWKRIRELAALVISDWPHPIFVRVWRLHSKRTADGILRKCRVLVYTEDLRRL